MRIFNIFKNYYLIIQFLKLSSIVNTPLFKYLTIHENPKKKKRWNPGYS